MGRFAIRPERAADSTISRIRRCTLGAARLVVVAVDAALAEVTRLMYQARRGPPAASYLRLNAAYFVGFGAGPEEEMWRTLLRRSRANAAIRLDATKARDFPGVSPSQYVWELWKQTWRDIGCGGALLCRRRKLEPVASNREDYVNLRSALRMGEYILLSDLVGRESRTASISEVVFISAAISPAFACIDAGYGSGRISSARAASKEHSRCLHFPVLKMLTQSRGRLVPDSIYLTSEIEVLRPQQRVEGHRPCILVASIYEVPRLYKNQDLARVQSLVLWANQNNLEVVIRKHPRETDQLLADALPRA